MKRIIDQMLNKANKPWLTEYAGIVLSILSITPCKIDDAACECNDNICRAFSNRPCNT